jgi:hypothetical protein
VCVRGAVSDGFVSLMEKISVIGCVVSLGCVEGRVVGVGKYIA